MYKTDAAMENIRAVRTDTEITGDILTLNGKNAADMFRGCDVICEALDEAVEKAVFVNTVLSGCLNAQVVSGSGMAGRGRYDYMKTEHRLDRLYICGDGTSSSDNMTLMAPRVSVCAGMMADTVLDLLLSRQKKNRTDSYER